MNNFHDLQRMLGATEFANQQYVGHMRAPPPAITTAHALAHAAKIAPIARSLNQRCLVVLAAEVTRLRKWSYAPIADPSPTPDSNQ